MEFTQIPGYHNYLLSKEGLVFSIKKGIILSARYTTKGYLQVDLHTDKNKKTFYIHRLVAESFIPNPENKPQVNHLDGNKSNNNVCNLDWATAKENSIHAINNGLHAVVKYIPNFKPKEIENYITGEKFKSIKEAANAIGITAAHLSKCLSGIKKNKTKLRYKKC